ncbi:hypothetical protein [Persephonella sp.]
MEVWVSIGGEKKKLQGSFKSVMETLYTEGKGTEVKLFSIHAPKKELRRFKRELRKNGRNILETAKNIARWFYIKEMRKARRCIKDHRKKTDPVSAAKVEKARKILEETKSKLEALS